MSTKVFVGNLDFNTTDQVLKDAFAHCGPVKRGVIITRGRRPLGYGFVEFDSPEVALASVEKMNKAELLGRLIKVEVAKDHPKDFQWKNVNTEIGGGKETGPAPRRQKRRGNANDLVGEDDLPASNPAPIKASPEDAFAGDAPRSTPNTRRRRKTKKVRPVTEKILSKTTLFVANLPFSVDDEKLKSIFEGTNVKSARVVRTRNGRSRGYGFVEFEDEKDQIAAMQAKNDIGVEGTHGERKISVTISNSISPPEDVAVTSPTTSIPEGSQTQVIAVHTGSGSTSPSYTGHQVHTPTGSTSPTGSGHQVHTPSGSASPSLTTGSGHAHIPPSTAHPSYSPSGPTSPPLTTGSGHQVHVPVSTVHQSHTPSGSTSPPLTTGSGHQVHAPGSTSPPPTSPGHHGPGSTSPPPTSPGHHGPGSTSPPPTSPGHHGPGSTSPPPTSPGHHGPGSTSPPPTSPGHHGPGSTSPPPTSPGHQVHAPGSTSPPPTSPAPQAHTSAIPPANVTQGRSGSPQVHTTPTPTSPVHQGTPGNPTANVIQGPRTASPQVGRTAPPQGYNPSNPRNASPAHTSAGQVRNASPAHTGAGPVRTGSPAHASQTHTGPGQVRTGSPAHASQAQTGPGQVRTASPGPSSTTGYQKS